ncbi:hypothetical protein LTR22_001128 [Elasticomyces elasticus]|nr:hypothetical protein LTR22_001128 [Elasticomyces elasticus]KAK4925208.1 hypothetical protein LTR49_007746 [Elasticomyces elasticus]KAK5767700.1 hypothetical protein LTS12_002202 [Elasticomyces elasticus]
MLKAAPRPDKLSEHGRNIYAYTNIRTSQVLYSLSQTLDSHASLKQLPDLGANHTPPKLRKDVWKPLWTLALPSSEPHARAQGLHAFKKLREYRKLHELNWKPSPLLNIEHERKKLDERGGSKKENVYDVIARRKWNLRVKEIMDQKATSIADLAAVLSEQDEMGQKTAAKRKDEMAIDREAEVKEILALSEAAEKGELKELEAQLDAMRLRLESSEPDAEGKSKGMLRREFNNLFGKRARMQFAADAVADIKDQTRIQQRRDAAREEEEDRAMMTASKPKPVSPKRTRAEEQAHRLRVLAKEARSEVQKRLETQLEVLEADLSSAVANGEIGKQDEVRKRIRGNRLHKGYIEIVDKALRANPNILAAQRDVEIKMAEFAVDLGKEELAKAETENLGADAVEGLQSAVGKKEALLLRLQTPQDGNKPELDSVPKRAPAEDSADRLRLLASNVQAGAYKHLDQKIAALRSELAVAVSDGGRKAKQVQYLRKHIHTVRYLKAKVEIVEKALQTSPDIVSVQDDVHLKMQESAVELRREELAEAKAEGRDRKEVEQLERAVEKSLSQSERKQAKEDGAAVTYKDAQETERDDEEGAVEASQSTSSVEAQDAVTEPLAIPATDEEWAARLPSFPPRDIAKLPKKSELRSKLRRLASPVFSTEGVKVKWSDLLEAEFAPSWPGNVVHERMGWAKYTAPRGEQEAIENIGEWRKGVWKSRTTANWEEGAAEGEAGQGEEGVQDPEMALQRQRAEHERQARMDFIKGVKGNILRKIREGEEHKLRAMGRTLPERLVESRVEA